MHHGRPARAFLAHPISHWSPVMKLPTRPAASQAGLTLIELIVLIVILGVLAAVALPRFINVQSDARLAKLKAYAGSIQAGAALAKSAAMVAAVDCSTAAGPKVKMEGTDVNLAYCSPEASANGIGVAAN